MKIAFVSTVQGHKWPGSEYLWSACAEQLLTAGHQIFVNVSSDLKDAAALKKLQSVGAQVTFSSSQNGRLSRLQERYVSPYNVLTRQEPDLLVISSGSPYDPVYRSALGRFLLATNIPFIFICHFNAETFWVDDPMREMMSQIFLRARKVIFVSQENHRITERQLAMTIPVPEVIVPPLCVNAAEPLPWEEKNDAQPWRFACVARLESRWKGQDVVFEVLSDQRWKERNFVLSLFGEGAEAGHLKKLSQFYGLENKVVFAGFASPETIWRSHHLQVLAARGEGGPMVITEGMMYGRAAITTRCGFTMDYISDGDTGFLADCATSDCFGRKMEEAWSRRAEWKEMGVKAHHFIKQRLGDFNASERLLKSILNGNHRAA